MRGYQRETCSSFVFPFPDSTRNKLTKPSSPALAIASLRGAQQETIQIPYLGPLLLIFGICTAVYLVYFTYHDYLAFLALGPGGTPSDFYGYLRIKFLSLFALKDPFSPAASAILVFPETGYLAGLPKRAGVRPVVKGIAPHRQQTQRPSSEVFGQLEHGINSMADNPAHQLIRGTSCFEKHGPGLFAIHPRAFAFSTYYSLISSTETEKPGTPACGPVGKIVQRHARRLPSNCPHEVCHAHPSDGSLHMTLHPADAKLVLESGWGERHPLARGGWFERFVPGGFIMVYAPRTSEEVATILRIVEAAVWWIADETVEGEKPSVAK